MLTAVSASLITVASKKVTDVTSLATVAPAVAGQWHKGRNGSVTPADVHYGSPNKAWWLCSDAHEWFATIRERVRRSARCPFCAGKRASATHAIALDRRALSLWDTERNGSISPWDHTPGSNRKFWWRCPSGHSWQATANNLVRGSGCPQCRDFNESNSEVRCRGLLEEVTGHSVPKSRPTWLRNARGFQMELDGYSEPLKVAFEFHGIQHFQFTPFFHPSPMKLIWTKQCDREKRAICLTAGVTLLEIRWDCADVATCIKRQVETGGGVSCGT